MAGEKQKIRKMTSAELREANDSQVLSYFRSYDRFWRLNKLLLLKRLLSEREGIRGEFAEYYGPNFTPSYDETVYRNVTDGILADAVSETVMLCEDYFVILRYIRETREFVKKAVYYRAGEVTALPPNLEKPNDETLRRMFFVPVGSLIETSLARSSVATANGELRDIDNMLKEMDADHRSIVLFHRGHSYFQGQYKHGLKLALNGLGGNGPMKPEELARRKSEFKGPLWYFENRDQSRALESGGLMVPDITNAALRNGLAYLAQTNNMLRLGYLRLADIDYLIATARHIVGLISTMVNNRVQLIQNARENKIVLVMPLPSGSLRSKQYTIVLHTDQRKPTIDDYQL